MAFSSFCFPADFVQLIYSADFKANGRTYQLLVDEYTVPPGDGNRYRLRLRYRSAVPTDGGSALVLSVGGPLTLSTPRGTPSASVSYLLSGAGLTAATTVTPSLGYEVSLDGLAYLPSQSVPLTGDAISPTRIFLRLNNGAGEGVVPGMVRHVSGGVSRSLPVVGSVTTGAPAPTITAVAPVSANATVTVTGTHLANATAFVGGALANVHSNDDFELKLLVPPNRSSNFLVIASANGVATATLPLATPVVGGTYRVVDGAVEVDAKLVSLADREVFVSSLLERLDLVATELQATPAAAADAPFGPVPLGSTAQRTALEAALREQHDHYKAGLVGLLAAPTAGILLLSTSPRLHGGVACLQAESDARDARLKLKQLSRKATDAVKDAAKAKVAKAEKAVNEGEETGFAVDSVQLHIEDGNVYQALVHGKFQHNGVQETEVFSNFAPIGISTRRDLINWHRQLLFPQRVRHPAYKSYYVNLGEIVNYVPQLSTRSSDLSPQDGVYTIRPTDPRVRHVLYKPATDKILQARVYSDLNGIDQDRPNGLIQVEASKRFSLNNNYSKRLGITQSSWFNFIEPSITLAKVEEKSKYFPLKTQKNGETEADEISTIDLIRYTSFTVASQLNLVNINVPYLKSILSLNGKVGLHRTPTRDSLYRHDAATNTATFQGTRDQTLSTIGYGLTAQLAIRPDGRYGAHYQLEWARYALTSEGVVQTPTVNGTGRSFSQKFLHQDVVRHQIVLWAKITEHSELFFRPQFTFLRRLPTQHYFQAQVGYQFDVFSTRRSGPSLERVLR